MPRQQQNLSKLCGLYLMLWKPVKYWPKDCLFEMYFWKSRMVKTLLIWNTYIPTYLIINFLLIRLKSRAFLLVSGTGTFIGEKINMSKKKKSKLAWMKHHIMSLYCILCSSNYFFKYMYIRYHRLLLPHFNDSIFGSCDNIPSAGLT